MPIVLAKCTECGGTIKVESDKKLAVCENCGQPFVVEEAINNFTNYYETNYITNNNTTHNYSDGTVVNVYEDNNKDFVIEGGVLKKYCGESINVVIPKNVIEIDSKCFDGLAIKTVNIAASVRAIDDWAFSNCSSIESIIVDDENKHFSVDNGVLINKVDKSIIKATNRIINYVIPNSINKINASAFENCEVLKNIIIPEGVKIIGHNSFRNCESLLSINLPDSLIEIGIGAFENCKSLKEISIPKSVEMICDESFKGCNLSSIKIERNYYFDCQIHENIKRLQIPASIIESNNSHRLYHTFEEIEVIYDGYISKNALDECRYWLCNNKIVGSSKKKIEEKIKENEIEERKSNNLCQYCGGKFYYPYPILNTQQCQDCGKKKDY